MISDVTSAKFNFLKPVSPSIKKDSHRFCDLGLCLTMKTSIKVNSCYLGEDLNSNREIPEAGIQTGTHELKRPPLCSG